MSALASYAFASALVLLAFVIIEGVIPRVFGAHPWIQFGLVFVLTFGGIFVLHSFELAISANVNDYGPARFLGFGMIPLGARRGVALLRERRGELFAKIFISLVALTVAGMSAFAIAQRLAR